MTELQPIVASAPFATHDPFDRKAFAALYPQVAGTFAHELASNPLFAWDRLAQIVDQGDEGMMQVRETLPDGRFEPIARMPASKASLVEGLPQTQNWIMLRDLDRWPDFAPLVADIHAAIGSVAQPRTGELLLPTAYLFLSSPGLLTPLHFDPEFNILFHIAGDKNFTVLRDEAGVPNARDNEVFHKDGDNLIGWQDRFSEQGETFPLKPGDALHVPFKAAHYVGVGDAPSISLSVTWRSRDSLLQDDAWAMNAWMRRRGLAPRPIGQSFRAKGNAMRALRRLRLA